MARTRAARPALHTGATSQPRASHAASALAVGWLLALGGAACGESAPPAPAPPPPPPAPPPTPPPPPPEPEPEPEGDIVVGFARDRIEIREGETLEVEVLFEADTENRSAWFNELRVPLRVRVEAGSAGPDDVAVARRVGVYGFGLGSDGPVSDVSLIPLRARQDGILEGPESLRLRLATESEPAEGLRFGEEVEVAFRNAEIEVVIVDGPDRCADLTLTAAAPRRSRSGASCQRGIYQTDVVLVTGTPAPVRLDPDPISRVIRIRSEPAGTGFRHEMTIEWKLGFSALDFRFRPCTDPGRGPALLCSNVDCRVYAEGEELPPPEPPVCALAADAGGAP